ncbi:MAG TPA: hypothetical protein VEF04_11515 [Blastocatellia bacterium]|nr:hypothetical protein [Blastocatellia bacterium]
MKLQKIGLSVIAICICLLIGQLCDAQDEPSQEDHEWVSHHFFTVLDEFLPVSGDDSLSYRSYQDLYTSVLEYSLVFNKNLKDNRVDVVVRMADSISIYDQLMSLHRKNPAESIESLKKKLKIKEWHLNDKSCPAVKSSYNDFESLNLPMLTAKERAERAKGIFTVTLHPTYHTF